MNYEVMEVLIWFFILTGGGFIVAGIAALGWELFSKSDIERRVDDYIERTQR